MLASVPQIQPMVEQFGMEKVWLASIEVLGFPVNWGVSTSQLVSVLEFLQNEKGDG